MRRRLGRSVAIGCAIATVAAIAVLIVARVAVLQTALDAGLAAYGIPDARYRIASVGISSTRFVDIALGSELAAADVVLRYRPLQLLRLEVGEVVIEGLRLDLGGTPAEASPGPVARLLSSGEAGGEPPRGLPAVPSVRIVDGSLRLPGDVTLTVSDARLSRADGEPAYELSLERTDIIRADQRFVAEEVTAWIAADFDRPGEPAARFTVTALRHDAAQPLIAPLALTGTIEPVGDAWRLMATATPGSARGARLAAAVRYDPSAKAASGRIDLPQTRFAAGGLQPADILPPLAVLRDVAGTVAGHIDIRWQSGRATADGTLSIDKLDFTVGGVPVAALAARLGLSTEGENAQPVLRIEQARVAMAGGTLSVDPVTLRPLAARNRVVLRAAGLDLARLIAAFSLDGVSGEGAIDGRIPLALADGVVAVEGGALEARGPGVLRIASQDVASALAQGGADTDLLLRALADFRYDRLTLTVDKPPDGESRLVLATYGRNPAVLDGHPFQINVTVTTNLDKILGVIAEGDRLSQRIIRAIVGAR